MPRFERQVRHLCEQVVASKTAEEMAELAQRLRALLNDHTEQLRQLGKVADAHESTGLSRIGRPF